uniref:MarR family winged helix-turn-helix transcriptional regulator n=1 Tax=Stappia sp. TaxID=1870903 RepID=UPI003BAB33E6
MDHVERIVEQWNRERPDLDVAPMALIGRLGRLARAWSREMEATFARHGLNAASFDLLATLRRAGPPYALSPGALIEATMVTSGTITNRIDRLVAAGLVERRPNPQDGRGFLVSLTPEGFSRIDACVTDHVATQARLVAPLDAADRAALEALLRKAAGTT